MTLPSILAPAGTPVFLADGHSVDERTAYAELERTTGHPRVRRVATAPARQVEVGWDLSAALMLAVETWYEDTLDGGSRHFTAYVANDQGEDQAYWDAVWLAPYTATPYATQHGLRWRVTGSLLLSGIASSEPPADYSLAAEFLLRLQASAEIISDASLAAEFLLYLEPSTSLAAEFSLFLEVTLNGARPSSVDYEKRWSWMRLPYARGHSLDLNDNDEAERRNWMGF